MSFDYKRYHDERKQLSKLVDTYGQHLGEKIFIDCLVLSEQQAIIKHTLGENAMNLLDYKLQEMVTGNIDKMLKVMGLTKNTVKLYKVMYQLMEQSLENELADELGNVYFIEFVNGLGELLEVDRKAIQRATKQLEEKSLLYKDGKKYYLDMEVVKSDEPSDWFTPYLPF
ncbi:hypothetical protein QF028_003069 [Neobacillus sp. B4I6]|uniref:hypothetical protein n=1 Tax=Neobacillus sp. B4I6 TaxID=3373925 RepID=UPI003D1BF950